MPCLSMAHCMRAQVCMSDSFMTIMNMDCLVAPAQSCSFPGVTCGSCNTARALSSNNSGTHHMSLALVQPQQRQQLLHQQRCCLGVHLPGE